MALAGDFNFVSAGIAAPVAAIFLSCRNRTLTRLVGADISLLFRHRVLLAEIEDG